MTGGGSAVGTRRPTSVLLVVVVVVLIICELGLLDKIQSNKRQLWQFQLIRYSFVCFISSQFSSEGEQREQQPRSWTVTTVSSIKYDTDEVDRVQIKHREPLIMTEPVCRPLFHRPTS